MPDILYIIGNGFDLHHGMKTSYESFKFYLQRKHTLVFDTVDKFLSIDERWSDFEEALGNLDVDHLENDASNCLASYGDDDWSDSGHHDYEYELTKNVEALSLELYEHFCEWINTVDIPNNSTLLNLKSHAQFLTFNYTQTLTELYSIPDSNVLHIHGSIDDPSNEIVLGHGWAPEDRTQLTSHIDENTDTRIASGYQIVDKYFSRTYKSTNSAIKQNERFFSSLSDLRDIYILGHSMSYVDFEYFRIIVSQVNSETNWYISFHKPEDKISLSQTVMELGLSESSVHFIKMEEVK
ncbi:bacteriophage abortive infection AbiH family protein [Photobacterium phosphoreum]|uniref:bacteriophage abortive infection AbiH family protein n=1 Tax=Photobacterium phosphoreum TaxID=659 RepID=UPI0039B02C01